MGAWPHHLVARPLGGLVLAISLEEALAWADACLIGAGTLRAHQCTCCPDDLLQATRVTVSRLAVVVSHGGMPA